MEGRRVDSRLRGPCIADLLKETAAVLFVRDGRAQLLLFRGREIKEPLEAMPLEYAREDILKSEYRLVSRIPLALCPDSSVEIWMTEKALERPVLVWDYWRVRHVIDAALTLLELLMGKYRIKLHELGMRHFGLPSDDYEIIRTITSDYKEQLILKIIKWPKDEETQKKVAKILDELANDARIRLVKAILSNLGFEVKITRDTSSFIFSVAWPDFMVRAVQSLSEEGRKT